MAMRKPFVSPAASAAGAAMPPGMAMPPQAGITGPQPQMPMGGKPQGDPMQSDLMASSAAAAAPGAPGPIPTASPGGPTAPLNIGQMLQARMGDRSVAPQQGQGPQGGQPGQPPLGNGMPAWGDQGTRMDTPGADPMAPKRVPYNAGSTNDGTGIDPTSAPMSSDLMGNNGQSAIMMRLLRTLGKI